LKGMSLVIDSHHDLSLTLHRIQDTHETHGHGHEHYAG
jgi:hypothetical protein